MQAAASVVGVLLHQHPSSVRAADQIGYLFRPDRARSLLERQYPGLRPGLSDKLSEPSGLREDKLSRSSTNDMCGRYSLTTPPEVLAALFKLAEIPAWAPRYNVAPTQEVPVEFSDRVVVVRLNDEVNRLTTAFESEDELGVFAVRLLRLNTEESGDFLAVPGNHVSLTLLLQPATRSKRSRAHRTCCSNPSRAFGWRPCPRRPRAGTSPTVSRPRSENSTVTRCSPTSYPIGASHREHPLNPSRHDVVCSVIGRHPILTPTAGPSSCRRDTRCRTAPPWSAPPA